MSLLFPQVPFLQVKGPLLVVQLLETTLLCLVSYARYFGMGMIPKLPLEAGEGQGRECSTPQSRGRCWEVGDTPIPGGTVTPRVPSWNLNRWNSASSI